MVQWFWDAVDSYTNERRLRLIQVRFCDSNSTDLVSIYNHQIFYFIHAKENVIQNLKKNAETTPPLKPYQK